jgi:SH3 domain-containing YSC84-like protein 1
LAIITVVKAAIIGSARFGSGIVVARLPDGTWSAPSAVALAGSGIGQQIGFQLTDFVFILNDSAAVRTFSQAGSLTLGGNLTVTAGPVGRSAEAAGTASLKGVGGIFSYSKTKGLFAGISLEGSAIVERRDANEKLYGRRYTGEQLLSGRVEPPPAAMQLISVLNSGVFGGTTGEHRGIDGLMRDSIPQDDIYSKGHFYSKEDIYSRGPSPMGLDTESVVRGDKGRSSNTDDSKVRPRRALAPMQNFKNKRAKIK